MIPIPAPVEYRGTTMKNVLMISPIVPDHSGTGLHKRGAAHLNALARNCRVHLIIFADPPSMKEPLLESLRTLCQTVVLVPVTQIHNPLWKKINIPLFAVISEIIRPTIQYTRPSGAQIRQGITGLDRTDFDAVFCFSMVSTLIFDRMKQFISITAKRKIVDFNDIESISLGRALEYNQHGFEIGLIQKITALRYKRIENRLLRTYDDVLVCSDLDKNILQKKALPATVHTLPNSVSLQPVMPPMPERDTLHILFVGLIAYGPNRDGILWFCRDILPLIRKQAKTRCRVSIVGPYPPAEVQALAEIEDVVVTGYVESVKPYYDDCDLVIAPIRFGGGTRIKILEAMSFQKPVVATTIGAEGIDIEDGRNIMIGDSLESFAGACVALLESASRRHAMGQEGRKCIEEKYSAEVVAGRLNQILRA